MEDSFSPKIACFLQVFNEIKTGHLERFVSWNKPLYDVLCVYDDASDDGSTEFLSERADLLIKGSVNQFKNEQQNKSLLLEAAKDTFPSIKWFLWLDADEVLYCSRSELDALLVKLESEDMDAASLPHINLWRSEHFLRTDEYFDKLEPVRLWRNSKSLSFDLEGGLHRDMHPRGLRAIKRLSQPAVVHYGFASDKYIVDKVATYSAAGQNGWQLNRLMSERGLQLENLSSRQASLGERWLNRQSEEVCSPVQRTTSSWMFEVLHRRRADRLSNHRPQVTVVTLIYKSCEWLEFIYGEMLRMRDSLGQGVVELLVVANDADPEVLDFLKENFIPHIALSTRVSPDEWFINSVYRAYNEGLLHARGEYVLFINSDMAFSPDFLLNIWRNRNSKRLLTGRLIEQGVLSSGKHGLEKSFGSRPDNFRQTSFQKYARKIRMDELYEGGLYMPLLVDRSTFIELGLFPEGNLTPDAVSTYVESGKVTKYAELGEDCVPGDRAFFLRASTHGISHYTDFGAIAYHFQAGEMRLSRGRQVGSGIALINDSIDGINGERVLWRMCSELLSKSNIRVEEIESKGRVSGLLFHLYVRHKLRKIKPVRVCFGNATYSYPLPKKYRRLVLRQDLPSSRRLRFMQDIVRRHSNLVLTNDADFSAEETMETRQWMMVPLSQIWSQDAPPPRKVHIGIFVGAFNDTKGWPLVKNLVETRSDVRWILVSKYSYDEHGLAASQADNYEVHRCLTSEQLIELMESASFFVLGSEYETQCLAALEAASRNLAVLMPPTGLLGGLDIQMRERIGVFTTNLAKGLDDVLQGLLDGRFEPRSALLELGIFEKEVMEDWMALFVRELEASFSDASEIGIRSSLFSIVSRIEAKSHYILYRLIRPTIRSLRWRMTSNFRKSKN